MNVSCEHVSESIVSEACETNMLWESKIHQKIAG